MKSDFFGNLYKCFIENDFLLIDGFFDKASVDEKSKFVGIYKCDGNFVYYVILMNKDTCGEEYDKYIYRLREKTDAFFSNINEGNVVFLNIIVTNNINPSLREFLESFYFDGSSARNDLCWAVDYNKKEIASGSNQPDKILNIHKIIFNSFYDNQITEGEDFYEIARGVKNKKEREFKATDSTITFGLIILNIIVFVVMELNGGSENTENLIRFGAVSNELVFDRGEFFRLFTDMFVHIGFAHIAANCFSLYILGTRSEQYFGKAMFLFIYIFSGIGASLASVMFTESVSAGASGAIFGIMGAMLVYSNMSDKPIADFSGYFMVLFSLTSIGAGFFMSGIDNAGHIGGFVTGALLTFIINKIKMFKK